MFAWKHWAKGLLAALIGGATTAATNAIADPNALSKPKELATMAGIGGVVAGLGYLKTHPPVEALPDELEPLAVAGIGIAVNKIDAKITKPKKPA